MNGKATSSAVGVDRDPLLPLYDEVYSMIGRRVRDLRIEVRDRGLVLYGRADSYLAMQLAEHVATAVTYLPVTDNRIEVTRPWVGMHRPDVAEFGKEEAGSARTRVLLTTGDSRLQSAGRDHLTEQGCVVATAAGGVECVARLREFAPDVVVLDTDLLWGGADGVLAQLRAAGDARVPVVLLTSPSDVLPWLVGRVADPVAAEIEKPVAMETLWRAVRSAAGEAAASGPEA